jgi:hypothetical protein
MKNLLPLFFLLFPLLAFSQTATPDVKTIPLSAKTAVISHYVDQSLNFYSVDFGGHKFLKDATGLAMRFTSYFDALQYMNSQGWEYVDVFNDVGIDDRTDQVILIKKKGA